MLIQISLQEDAYSSQVKGAQEAEKFVPFCDPIEVRVLRQQTGSTFTSSRLIWRFEAFTAGKAEGY